jgi:hypothetical protein
MPTTVIRNGKIYTEYTPQELSSKKLEKEIQQMQKHGVRVTQGSMFNHTYTTNPSHIKKKHGI